MSHGSTESEIMYLDASLRMDRIPALDLWDLVVVLHSNSSQKPNFKQARSDPSYSKASEKRVNSQCNTQVSQRHLEMWNVDFVSSNVNSSHKELFCTFLKTTKL